MKRKIFSFIVFISIGLTACNLSYFEDGEFGEFVWDPTLAIPLGELNYTVSELFSELDDGSASIEPGVDNVVNIIYEETLRAQDAKDFLEVLDQTFTGDAPTNRIINSSPTNEQIVITQVFEFDLNTQGDEAYDSIYFNQGGLNLILNSSLAFDVAYTVSFISLVENELVMISAGTLAPFGGIVDPLDISSATGLFHLDANGGSASNKFVFEISYSFDLPIGGNVSASEGLSFEVQMRNASYSELLDMWVTKPQK